MKEILAKRDKSAFIFIAAIGIAGLAVGLIEYLLFMSNFNKAPWLPILILSVSSLITASGLICLCFPNAVIVKQGQTLVIDNGVRGIKKVNVKDVIAVKEQQLPTKAKPTKKGNIILTVKQYNYERDIVVINVKNKAEAAEKIKSVINN